MIGWGIVGTGRMAATMAAALGSRVVAVASRDVALAQQFALTYGIAFPCDMAGMLRRPDVDVVYIASPVHAHEPDCLRALAAGKHVLCEKPLAATAAEARTIVAAAAGAGRFCMEALWTHFLPAVTEAARRVEARAIGAPTHLTASFGLPTDTGEAVFRAPGGGALLDRGCYPISLALRLLAAPVDVAGAVLRRNAAGVETDATLMLCGLGITAEIAVSLTCYLANDLVVSGPGGRITLSEPITSPALVSEARATAGRGEAPGLRRRIGRAVPHLAAAARLRGSRALPFRGSGYIHQIEEVEHCIEGGRVESAVVPLSLSLATLAVIDAAKMQFSAIPIGPPCAPSLMPH